MSPASPQIVPPPLGENSTPAEVPLGVSPPRPSPADPIQNQFEGGAPLPPGDGSERRDNCASGPATCNSRYAVTKTEGRGQRTLTTKPDLAGSNGALSKTERPLGQCETGPTIHDDPDLTDRELLTRPQIEARMGALYRRIMVLSERLAALGVPYESLSISRLERPEGSCAE